MNPLTPEETQQLARFSLDHADDGALWVDAEGRLLYLNPAACRMVGYTPAELLGTSLFKLSPELTPELWSQLWKEAKTRETFSFEFNLQGKENRIVPVEINVHYLSMGRAEVLCAFFRDVNERKRLQQLKNEFVSTVSHELRTPMTIIRESVSQLLDGLWGEIPSQQKDALFITLSGLDRLARIINDLLDVSKMEAGKATLRWERLNMAELVREVVETFASRARERGLDLRVKLPAEPVILYADYDRIVQVVTNLVGNALKFSEKGTIEVAVRTTEAFIECAVSDHGIGISPQELGKVFSKFEQLSQPAVTGEKGSGLGLSICKGIVELHQGRITVESQLGRGSTFTFTLPHRTAKDLFRQRMEKEMAQASVTGGHISAAVFTLRQEGPADPRKTTHDLNWALDELSDIAKGNGRKNDFLLKGDDTLWLGQLHMTRKENTRLVERILEAYQAVLQQNDLAGALRVSVKHCSYPEDVKSEKEFLEKLKDPGEKDAG